MLELIHDRVTELSEASLLPRIDAHMTQVMNKLYDRAAPITHALRGSTFRLQWEFDSAAASCAAPATLRDSYRFKLGTHIGHLGLDVMGTAALLGERRIDLLPRDLRYILLADALHPLMDALEKALRLHIEWVPPSAEVQDEAFDPQRAVFFSVTTATHHPGSQHINAHTGFRGHVQFNDAAALNSLVHAVKSREAAPSDALDLLRIPVSFSLGSTQIRLREVGSICPGDIINIDEWKSSGAGIVVTAELGGLRGKRLVGIAEGSRITIQQSKDKPMNRDNSALASTADEVAGLPIDRLDALEVALRFEVGDLQVTLGELKSIGAGHVFDLGQPLNRSPVRILAHGNVLGKGHLVAVGDRLGVRVSEFAPSEI